MATPTKYTDKNVGQCWNCKNCVGHKKILNEGKYYLLPECKVTECYMTHVCRDICSSFIKIEKE